jgi:hypothetical protein
MKAEEARKMSLAALEGQVAASLLEARSDIERAARKGYRQTDTLTGRKVVTDDQARKARIPVTGDPHQGSSRMASFA